MGCSLPAQLPDDTRVSVTIGGYGPTMAELKAARAKKTGPLYITTHEAARRYGWSRKYWAKLGPTIPGAFNDAHWHLPVEGCEAHVAAKRRRVRVHTTPTFTTPSRPPGLQER